MKTRALGVVPRPRRVEPATGTVRFDPPFGIDCEGEGATDAADLCATLLERETNEPARRVDESAAISLRLVEEPPAGADDPEGYVLEADPNEGTTVTAASADGLRHGCQTLVGALRLEDGRWTLPACTVSDRPETPWRGFMLDPARGFLPVERVKRRIDQAARAKYNRLHLHLLDDESYALESAAFPELNRDADGAERPAYSPEDVSEIVAYAARRGIEVVPEVDVPAHAGHLLETYPELRCTVPDGEPADRVACIGSEETLQFVETLLEEVLEQFPFPVVHVGGDEWEMHGHSWDECVDCRRKMAADGSESAAEHFYVFVRRLHGFLAERDRRLMCWNDQIDVSESPDLPRNALIQFWRVAAPGRGPVEGCAMDRFLEEGFEVVNSYVHAAYVNGWITEEYVYGWAPRKRPSVPAGSEERVLGGELLAWEPSDEAAREYFERALPSALPIFADRLWNGEPIDDRDSFSRAVTRHALGPHVPDGFDVYRELGGTILPTWWKRPAGTLLAHANASLGDRAPEEAADDYREALETLAALRESGRAVYPETASAYESALEWLLEVADREGRGVIDRP